jgi:hypothetical protein
MPVTIEKRGAMKIVPRFFSEEPPRVTAKIVTVQQR